MNWANVFYFLGTDVPLQALVWTIVALGVFIAFKVLGVADMSVDALFPFSAILSLFLINLGVPSVLALLIAVIASMGVGFINSALHVYLKIDPLLAGIIVMIALYTPNLLMAKGTISIANGKSTMFMGINGLFNNMIASKIFLMAIICLAVLVLAYWFFGTELGLSLRASGKNSNMSKANGINTNGMYILGLVISSALIGLAGGLYGQLNTYSTNDSGRGSIVIGLAIIFLGEVIFGNKSFKFSLLSLLVASILYWLILDIIQIIPDFSTTYLNLTKAIFITLIVCVYELKKVTKKKSNIKKALLVKEDA